MKIKLSQLICLLLPVMFFSCQKSEVEITLPKIINSNMVLQRDQVVKIWGWGNGEGNANYTVYFWCQLSKPLDDYGFWSADFPDGWIRKRDEVNLPAHRERVATAKIIHGKRELGGKHIGFFTEFPTVKGEQVLLKTGISFVSVEGARENLEMDIPGWDFDNVKAQARNRWNEALQSVQVSGNSEEDKMKFYTALYHTMIDPRSYADSNGKFIGADNKVHQSETFTYRTIFSGWDVFRSQFPLQTIINPRMVNDEINTLLHMAEASGRGYLPRWWPGWSLPQLRPLQLRPECKRIANPGK